MRQKIISVTLVIVMILSIIMPSESVVYGKSNSKPSLTIENANTGEVTMMVGKNYSLVPTTNVGKIFCLSSAKKIVSVDKNGKLKAHRVGKATITITAKSGKKRTVKRVKVIVISKKKYVALKGITVATETELLLGTKSQMNIRYTPADASNKNIIYQVSNKKVLKINQEGSVTPLKQGKCTVTIRSCDNKKIKKKIVISVRKPNAYEVDSDGDGYSNYIESNYMGTDPEKADGDSDTLESKTILNDEVKKLTPNVIRDWKAESDDTHVTLFLQSNDVEAQPGDILVAEPSKKNPSGASIKVEKVSKETDGSYKICGVEPKINEVVTYANFNEKMEPDFENITCAEGVRCEVVEDSSNQDVSGRRAKKDDKSPTVKTKLRYKFGKEGKDGFPAKDAWETDNTWSAGINGYVEVEIDSVKLSGKILPSFSKLKQLGRKSKPTGTEVRDLSIVVDGDMKIGIEAKAKRNIDKTISVIPLYGVMGEGIYLKIYFHYDCKGKVSLQYKVDYTTEYSYSRKKGWRITPKTKGSEFAVEVSGKLKTGINTKVAVELFGAELATVKFEPNLVGKISSKSYGDAPYRCDDVKGWLDVSLSAEFIPDVKCVEAKITVEFWNEKKSPLKFGLHWEDGVKVEKCTRDEKEDNQDGEENQDGGDDKNVAALEDGILREGSYHINFTPMENVTSFIKVSKGANFCMRTEYHKTWSSATWRPDVSKQEKDYSIIITSGVKFIDIDVYSGRLEFSTNKESVSFSKLFQIEKQDEPLFWHKVLKAGQSIGFENKLKDYILPEYADKVYIYMYSNEEASGTQKSVDSYFYDHTGIGTIDEKENVLKPNQKSTFYLSACEKVEYFVQSGEVEFYIWKDDFERVNTY